MKKEKRLSLGDIGLVINALNESIKDIALMDKVCASLNRALPLYRFISVNGSADVKENITIMHMPVKLFHPLHGQKIAYLQREAANDIRNGWELVQASEVEEKVEAELIDEIVSAEDPIVTGIVADAPKKSEDRDELIAMAEALKLEFDRRWGVKKLQEAVYA